MRRSKLVFTLPMVLGLLLSLTVGCQPQIVKETVIVEKPVEKVVKETIVVEKSVEKLITATPAPKEKIKLQCWSTGYGPEEFQQSLVDEFNRTHPDIEVTLDLAIEGLKQAEAMQKVRIALQNESGPDILGGVDVGAALKAYVESGQVLDLTESASKYGWDRFITPRMLGTTTIDGKLWAVPQDVNVTGYFYNRDMFEELGVEVPRTWDEYLNIMEKCQDAGYYGFSIGLSAGWPSAYMASEFMYLSAGSQFARVLAGEEKWVECEKCLAGLEAFNQLAVEGYTNPEINGIDQAQANDLFFQGQTATTLASWIQQIRDADPDFEVGFFLPPAIHPDTDIRCMGGVGGSVMVTKYCEHPEAAIEFVNFLFSREVGARSAKELGVALVAPFDIPAETDPLTADIVAEALAHTNEVGNYPVTYLAPAVFQQLNSFIQGMMAGELTPAEVLEDVQKAHETYLAEQGS